MTRAARIVAVLLLFALVGSTATDAFAAKSKKRHGSSHSTPKPKKAPKTAPAQAPASQPLAQLTAAAEAVATPIDYAHVALTWSPVNGAASYAVYRDNTLLARVGTTSFTDSLLWPSTAYGYRVDAIGVTGVVLSSQAATATTPALPPTGVPSLFSPSSIWNQPIGNAQPVANSSALISYLVANALHPNMTLHSWGVSVAEAQPGQPVFSVPCVRWSDCTLNAFGPFAIPLTAKPDDSGDAHLAVYDPTSAHEWDMWDTQSTSSGWTAGTGNAVSLTGDGIAPAHTAGADAANFPLLGGLVRPEEILQGHIDHALVFSFPHVSKLGHVCPATHNDGSSSDPNAMEEGTRVQLDPTLNVDQLPIPSWEKTLARAMQVYGMYLRDDGGALTIFSEDSASRGYDAWSKLGFSSTDGTVGLVGIPWNRLRVIAAPC